MPVLFDSKYVTNKSFPALLGPVTSTPFVRKTAAPKGRKTIGHHEIKVDVHDGVAMRKVAITTADSRLDLLEKICTAMKRPNSKVELGYEAPWSAKINNKKCVAYISNKEELDDFWLALARHMAAQKKKLKGKSEVADPGIIFHNILDSTPVRTIVFKKARVLTFLRIQQSVARRDRETSRQNSMTMTWMRETRRRQRRSTLPNVFKRECSAATTTGSVIPSLMGPVARTLQIMFLITLLYS